MLYVVLAPGVASAAGCAPEMPAQRFDRSEMRSPRKTREGWLRADGYLTRTGVFEYRLGSGRTRRELRTPEEVFHADALASFGLVPLTREHPEGAVTSDNWRALAVGTVGEQLQRDGEFVRASLLITDPDAVKELEQGERRELSCGYTCDVVEGPGEWNGLHYDATQKNIRGNHVALVTRGRAGPEVRVHLDAADALETTLQTAEGGPVLVKYRVDGVEFDVSEQARQALEREAGKRDAEAEGLRGKAKAAEELAEREKRRADEAEGKLAESEKARADAVDPKRVADMVKARVALHTAVGPILGAAVKLDDMSERDIKVAVLKKQSASFKEDGLSDDYLNGRFEGALVSLKTSTPSPLERARAAAVSTARSDTAPDDAEAAARARMVEDARNAWKPKSAAH